MIRYLYTVRMSSTYWQDFNDDLLSIENPRMNYPWYSYGKDYTIAIRKNEVLHVFIDFNKNRAYFVNKRKSIKMWQGYVNEGEIFNFFGHQVCSSKLLTNKRAEAFIRSLQAELYEEE